MDKFLQGFSLLCLIINCYATDNRDKTTQLFKDIAKGGAAGIIEPFITQPCMYYKNMVQQGNPIEWKNPKVLWRGTGVSAASFSPSMAIQFAGKNLFLKKIKEPRWIEKLIASYLSGILSGFISCPSENIMMHQQNTGNNFTATSKMIINNTGLKGLYRGLMPTMQRNGGFSAGLFGLRPIIDNELKEYSSKKVSFLASSVIAGIIVGTLTHPCDTLKTVMQKESMQKDAPPISKVIRDIYHQKSFYKGLKARLCKLTSVALIIGLVTD